MFDTMHWIAALSLGNLVLIFMVRDLAKEVAKFRRDQLTIMRRLNDLNKKGIL